MSNEKEIGHQDIIDQRLALAKWIAANPDVCKFTEGDVDKTIEILVNSELFGDFSSVNYVVLTSHALGYTDAIRLPIIRGKIKPQRIVGVHIKRRSDNQNGILLTCKIETVEYRLVPRVGKRKKKGSH